MKDNNMLPSPPEIVILPYDVLADIYQQEDEFINKEIESDDIIEYQKACLI